MRDPSTKVHSDGFGVFETYLDAAIIDSLINDLAQLNYQDTGGHSRVSPNRLKRNVIFARRNLLSLQFMQEFIAGQAVRRLVEPIHPGAIPVRGILFDKTGEANWTVPWHQDRSIAVRERLDTPGFGPWSEKAGVVHVQPPVQLLREMVTLRFSLDACGLDSGPLRVIGGTHQRILGAAELDDAVRRGPEQVCITAAGGVVIMRPLTLHASSPAKSAVHRRVLHIEFGPPVLPGSLRWALA